jgi:ankyrin repeat protein
MRTKKTRKSSFDTIKKASFWKNLTVEDVQKYIVPVPISHIYNFGYSLTDDLDLAWGSGDALHHALFNNASVSAISALIRAGSDASQAPLTLAVSCSEGVEIVKLLISAGVDVNLKGPGVGQTPLHVTWMQPNTQAAIEIATILLDSGANVNARNMLGFTPLISAITAVYFVGHEDYISEPGLLVEHLINAGADVNARADCSHTALHVAANANLDQRATESLIKNGANIHAVNSKGKTPLDLALSKNNSDLIQVLS